MKKNFTKSILCVYLIVISFFAYSQTGGVSINKTNAPADPSAILDVSSTSAPYLGMLIPRMTTSNRNSIISPAVGLQIYNTDCGITEYYTGTCWISMGQNLKTPDHITCSGTTDFCANETRTFTISSVTGATNYEWTVPAGATITSGQGTPTATVVFGNNSGEVCVTAGNLCEASPNRCIDIHINPIPSIPGPITGPTTIQPGTTATYFINAVSGAGVYNWTVPFGGTITFGVGTTSINVSFSCDAVSGNVSVTAQSNCGTSYANSLSITAASVVANAGASITGPGTLGGSPTASGGTSPYTYSWSPSTNLLSTTVANPATTACTTTVYTVTVSDAKGCTVSSSTTVSDATPQTPMASANPNPICIGSSLTLSASSIALATYNWTGPNNYTSSTQSTAISNIQTNQAGTYHVTATVGGCTSAGGNVSVTVNALPVSTFTPSSGPPNVAVAFTPTTTGATYNWSFTSGSPSSSTAQNPSSTWSAPGTYNVSLTVTDVNNCSSTTTLPFLVVNPTSCFAIKAANPSAPDGIYTINPGSGPISCYCDMTNDGGGWTLVVRAANVGDNSLNTTNAYNVPPTPTGSSAKISHTDIQNLVNLSTLENPVKMDFSDQGVVRYIWKLCSWTSSGDRNKCASWSTNTTSTSHSTYCGNGNNPSLNNGGGGEWASDAIPWPYQDGICALNGGFSTSGNCCGTGNGDAWGNASIWNGVTGLSTTGRFRVNIWVK